MPAVVWNGPEGVTPQPRVTPLTLLPSDRLFRIVINNHIEIPHA
jgi:hypothetical protein